MYWNHTATLVKVTKATDDDGYKTAATSRREVFVNKKSATRSEFYKAKETGHTIALVLEVHGVDYQGETRVEFEGKPYDLVRDYYTSGEVVELNLEEAPEDTDTGDQGEEGDE